MKSFKRELAHAYDGRRSREFVEDWRKLSASVPFITLDAGWQIAIIPPFAGAAARFLVRDGDAGVSVYLDTNEALGCSDVVYWEVYPDGSGENGRCALEDGDALLTMIREGLAKVRAERAATAI